jgi:hypothetical protein
MAGLAASVDLEDAEEWQNANKTTIDIINYNQSLNNYFVLKG